MPSRYLEKYILDDPAEKMVFLEGPRQVGKMTRAKTSDKTASRALLLFEDYIKDGVRVISADKFLTALA